jgi:serine/threonine protein kinase
MRLLCVRRCKYAFPTDANASTQVKDLITRLLTRDYQKRYTVQECLTHPWFQATQASSEPLISHKKSVRERLAEFNAQRNSVYEKVKSVHRRLSTGTTRSARMSM